MDFTLDPETMIWLARSAFNVALAAVGGLLGYLMSEYNRQVGAESVKINWHRAWLEFGASGFGGLIVYMMCNGLGFNAITTSAVVGVCGWIGASATMALMRNKVSSLLGVSDSERKGEP